MAFFKIIGAEVNANNSAYGPEVFNANTGIAATGRINLASQKFANGTPVVYVVSAGNTVPTGLTSGQSYFAVYANTSGLNLSNSLGGANISISPTAVSETGHTLQGMNTLSATQVRIYNSSGVANNIHIVSNVGIEIANITLSNAEVIYIQKNPGDSVWCNGSMLTVPISYRGA